MYVVNRSSDDLITPSLSVAVLILLLMSGSFCLSHRVVINRAEAAKEGKAGRVDTIGMRPL